MSEIPNLVIVFEYAEIRAYFCPSCNARYDWNEDQFRRNVNYQFTCPECGNKCWYNKIYNHSIRMRGKLIRAIRRERHEADRAEIELIHTPPLSRFGS